MRRMPNLYLTWMKENKETTSKSDSIQRNASESVNA